MERPQSSEQAAIRSEKPEFATAEGRIADEVKRTIFALAQGKLPETVLGGLMMGHIYNESFDDPGQSTASIAARAGLNSLETNHRGDRIADVMEDLVETGWAERVGELSPVDQSLEQTRPIVRYRLIPIE